MKLNWYSGLVVCLSLLWGSIGYYLGINQYESEERWHEICITTGSDNYTKVYFDSALVISYKGGSKWVQFWVTKE